jgi:hypothetical protein
MTTRPQDTSAEEPDGGNPHIRFRGGPRRGDRPGLLNNRVIFVGQASLRHALSEYVSHYHDERNHQGLGNRLLRPLPARGQPHHAVRRRQRLGGMLSYYHRQAA